jgi:hypothetical protein
MARRNPWLRIGFDAWTLWFEASFIMGLRALKIMAGGPAANSQARRMIGEKIEAGRALQAKALIDGLGTTAPGAAAKTLSTIGARCAPTAAAWPSK